MSNSSGWGQAQKPETQGPNTSSQVGPSITTGTDTPGAWTQITAGFTYPVAGFYLHFEQMSVNARSVFDIGIGTAGSEVVVVPGILVHGSTMGGLHIPCPLPAGVAVSVRGQTSGTTITARCGLYAYGHGLIGQGVGRWGSVGLNLSGQTTGTQLDAGATANTLSAWVQLVASLTNPVRAIIMLGSGETISGNTSSFGLLDVGIGGAGSEQVLLDRLQYRLDAATMRAFGIGPFPVEIPAGTRLAIRAQANSNVAASARNMQWSALVGG